MESGTVKPWQIVLFIAAIGAVAFAAWNVLGGERVEMDDRAFMVDITTGELWVADLNNRGISIPARHPESDKYVLLRVKKDESGNWRLGRALDSLDACDARPSISITDGDLVEVINGDNPKRYRR